MIWLAGTDKKNVEREKTSKYLPNTIPRKKRDKTQTQEIKEYEDK